MTGDALRLVRWAFRGIQLRPGFSLTVVLTLAIGMGANGAMLGLVDRLLLSSPPHIANPERVVRLGTEFRSEDGRTFVMWATSFAVFEDVKRSARAFENLAAVTPPKPLPYGSGEAVRIIQGVHATGEYFAALGPRPLIGRFFGVEGDTAGGAPLVVVLSHTFWRTQLQADASVLGRTLTIANRQYTVIGVAPQDFSGDRLEVVDVWLPLSTAFLGQGNAWRYARGMNMVTIIGRLQADASPQTAANEATVAFHRGASAAGESRAERASLTPESLVPIKGTAAHTTQGRIALWLAGVSTIVLLISVANVSNLLLLRGVARRRDIALHFAMGAARRTIVLQLGVEALTLAAIGGVLGLILARWGGDVTRILLLPEMPPSTRLVSRNVLAVTASSILLTTLIAGILPAWRSTRLSLSEELKTGGKTAGYRHSKILGSMVVLQTALSVLLLVGAGLFVRSLHRVRAQDLGFTSDRVLIAELRGTSELTGRMSDERYERALQEVRRVPGVLHAAAVQALPFGAHHVPPIAVPGLPTFPDRQQQLPFMYAAAPEYFDIMGIRLIAGRKIAPSDDANSALVIILNEAMAHGLWPGESALGKCIRVGGHGFDQVLIQPCRTVVGVVSNARPRSIRAESGQALMQYYVPLAQMPPLGGPGDGSGQIFSLLIKTAEGEDVTGAIQRAMRNTSPDLPPSHIQPLQDLIDRQIRPWNLGARMFTAFGGIALLLAAVGLYGVRSYAVNQRSHEIGVRIALGARAGAVMRMVVLEGAQVTGIGVLLGAAAALFVGRFAAPLLFETSPRDPLTFACVAGGLLVVALLASLLPAMRAATIQPVEALRVD